jgi:hypothetical protein
MRPGPGFPRADRRAREAAAGQRRRPAQALLEPAAERGLADAQWSLGTLYLRGVPGLPRDPALAEALLRRPRRQPRAAFQLGIAQLSAGGPANRREALLWDQRAAFRGQKEAQELLRAKEAGRARAETACAGREVESPFQMPAIAPFPVCAPDPATRRDTAAAETGRQTSGQESGSGCNVQGFVLATSLALTRRCSRNQPISSGLPAGIGNVVVGGSGARISGSGHIIEDPRPITGFMAVRSSAPVDIRLKASDRESVTVRIDDNLTQFIETKVVPGEVPALEISVKPDVSFRTQKHPVVLVEY